MESSLFETFRQPGLDSRYVAPKHLEPFMERFGFDPIGRSVEDRTIYSLTIGKGKTRILMWSQMHGNEATTTRALIDFVAFLTSDHPKAIGFRDKITFQIIPMLNPDGSERYTRENANGVDLNRDFVNLSQPESRLLIESVDRFKPDYCFNLHDQRTIYGAGQGKPATVSFLSPSREETRAITPDREKGMAVIVSMFRRLSARIPGQIGRYDDAFNPNCVGDSLQMKGIPTILFEAGQYPNDYQRSKTRKLIFEAYLAAVSHISENVIVHSVIKEYLNIPQNKVNFNDFVFKNVRINYDGNEIIANLAAQYTEVKKGDRIEFEAYVSQIGSESYGHVEYDAKGALLEGVPTVGAPADFTIGTQRFLNGVPLKQL